MMLVTLLAVPSSAITKSWQSAASVKLWTVTLPSCNS